MFRRLNQSLFESSIKSAYTRRFKEKGAQAEGVFWSSRVSQTARFEQVLANMKAEFGSTNFYLADIGCGYGALFHYIQSKPAWRQIDYSGVDITPEMVSYCKREHTSHKNRFSLGRQPKHPVDFAVFIGTFNLCHTDDYELWEDYILRHLAVSWARVRYGLILNITSLETAKINNHIFYVNPEAFAKKLASRFGAVSAAPTQFVPQDTTFIICKEKHERHITKLRKAQR